jgi:hypothetical protein
LTQEQIEREEYVQAYLVKKSIVMHVKPKRPEVMVTEKVKNTTSPRVDKKANESNGRKVLSKKEEKKNKTKSVPVGKQFLIIDI